jgi:hypothetical protein
LAKPSQKSRASKPPIPDSWKGQPRFAVFFIPAVRSLPLPHGSTFTFFRGEEIDWLRGLEMRPTPQAPLFSEGMGEYAAGKNFVSLKVWRPTEKLQPDIQPLERAMLVAQVVVPGVGKPIGSTPPPDLTPSEGSFATVFEAVTPLLPVPTEAGLGVDRSIDDAFDRSIESLRQLVRAYVVMSKDARVLPPTRHSLYPFIPWTTRSPDGSDWGGIGLYLPNVGPHAIPAPTGTLDETHREPLGITLMRMTKGDPTAIFAEHARTAWRAFWMEGDHAAAAIEAHISTEVLLDAVLLMMAWEQGTSPSEAAAWFDIGLSRRLRTFYAPRLGGNWRTQTPNSVIGEWAHHVRDLRNQVAHRGYWPTLDEARRALETADKLEDFVKNRLGAKRNKYPRTTLLVLGRPGLGRLGLYAGQIKKFAETVANKEPDWLESYGHWAEEVEVHRARA